MKYKIITLAISFFLFFITVRAQESGDTFLGVTGGTFVSSLNNKDFFISRNKSNAGLSIGADFENYLWNGLSWTIKFKYYNNVGGQLNYNDINNVTLLNDDIPFEFRTSSGNTDIRYFIDYLEFIGSIKLNLFQVDNVSFFAEPHVGVMHPINAEGSINDAEKIDVMPSIGFDIFHGGLALGASFPIGRIEPYANSRTFLTTSLQYRFTTGSNVLFGRNILIDNVFDDSITSMSMFSLFVGVKWNIGKINILKVE